MRTGGRGPAKEEKVHGKRGEKEEGDGAARNRHIGRREAADKRRRVAIVNA